jgi:hypothetical protein
MLEYCPEEEEKDERSFKDTSDTLFEEPLRKIPIKNTQKQPITLKKKVL